MAQVIAIRFNRLTVGADNIANLMVDFEACVKQLSGNSKPTQAMHVEIQAAASTEAETTTYFLEVADGARTNLIKDDIIALLKKNWELSRSDLLVTKAQIADTDPFNLLPDTGTEPRVSNAIRITPHNKLKPKESPVIWPLTKAAFASRASVISIGNDAPTWMAVPGRSIERIEDEFKTGQIHHKIMAQGWTPKTDPADSMGDMLPAVKARSFDRAKITARRLVI